MTILPGTKVNILSKELQKILNNGEEFKMDRVKYD